MMIAGRGDSFRESIDGTQTKINRTRNYQARRLRIMQVDRIRFLNVNMLETFSPHLATSLSQPWLCERVIEWFMHSLDVLEKIRSNLSERIVVELLFLV